MIIAITIAIIIMMMKIVMIIEETTMITTTFAASVVAAAFVSGVVFMKSYSFALLMFYSCPVNGAWSNVGIISS